MVNAIDAVPSGGAPSPDAADYVTPPFLVAAVGASAGGLEAFSNLLREMPPDAPLALVLVQHMSRTQPSLLPEILAGRTALQVTQATDGVRIAPGHVYVIAPDTHMTVIDGHLRLRPRPKGRWSLQVDALFGSVAEYYREKGVGVILSGALKDGSAGFREIRAAGGITIAQLPAEAHTASMPCAAIATGDVDLVLPVDQIGQELLRLAAQPRFKRDAKPVAP
jgi:two-component system, chemotaxis family, CheB/CheR fusion protein